MTQETAPRDVRAYLPAAGPLSETNRGFHRAYDDLVARTRELLGSADYPVIVVAGYGVHLLWNRQEENAHLVPDRYHEVKAFSHLPLGLYLALDANGDGPLRAATRDSLGKAIAAATEAVAEIAGTGVAAELAALDGSIVDRSRRFVEEILSCGRVERSRVQAYARSVAPLLLENATVAAKLELDNLHRQVMAWKNRIPPSVWGALYVVICAGHQPRYRETTKQYFQRLLHEENGEDARFENRVVYAESIHDISPALDLLARHIIDQDASLAFFDHAARLQEDMLADAAARYVRELLP